jgi:transcriptional regulator with XRE-family HTH domain
MDKSLMGLRIRTLREAARLSQDELASRAGLSKTTYQNIEWGRANPEWETLAAIAGALGMDIPTMLPERERPALRPVDIIPLFASLTPEQQNVVFSVASEFSRLNSIVPESRSDSP